jgi:hypothetical protein
MESPCNDKNFESQHAVEKDSSEVQIYHIFILNHFSQKYNLKLHPCIHTTQHDAACQKTFAPDLSGGRHGLSRQQDVCSIQPIKPPGQ